jgi:hypothetical protein
MANILMIPASGSIIFDSQLANSSVISSLTGAPRLSYDNAGGLNITSYTTGLSARNRLSIDGNYGRLLNVSDSSTGIIFSVNDAAGLPVIEVQSNLTDIITMGTYGNNTLVVNDTRVGIGTATPSEALTVSGNIRNTALILTSGFASTGIAPATIGASGVSGQIAFSSTFLYRHNGTNWQRTGIGFANW